MAHSSISALFVCHADKQALIDAIQRLQRQTHPPDEIIALTCCIDTEGIEADVILLDRHYNDWGASKCAVGLHLATQERLMIVSVDDDYEPTFIERCLAKTEDVVLTGFYSKLVGIVTESRPEVGACTRGAYVVKTDIAKRVGYNDRSYSADGQFIKDLVGNGANWINIQEILHYHK